MVRDSYPALRPSGERAASARRRSRRPRRSAPISSEGDAGGDRTADDSRSSNPGSGRASRAKTLTNLPALDSSQPLQAVRVLVLGYDVARVDAIARALRAQGALVEVNDFAPSPTRLLVLRRFEPIVTVADEADLVQHGAELVDRLKPDPILHWSSWFSTDWNDVWSDKQRHAQLRHWLAPLRGFAEAERQLSIAVRRGARFELSCNGIGPSRVLRRLGRHVGVVRARFESAGLGTTVELTDGMVAGVQASDGLGGLEALRRLLGTRDLTVTVEFPFELKLQGVMQRISDAIEAALAEACPPHRRSDGSLSDEETTRYEITQPGVGRQRASNTGQPQNDAPQQASPTLGLFSTRPASEGPDNQRLGQHAPRWRQALPAAAILTVTGLLGFGITVALASLFSTGAVVDPAVANSPTEPTTAQQTQTAATAPPATKPETHDDQATPNRRDERPEGSEAPKPEANAEPAGGRCATLVGSEAPQGDAVAARREILRGRRALIKGAMEDAERSFCRAALITPTGSTYENLARYYLEHGKASEGLHWAERAVQANGSIDARLIEVDALAITGDHQRAREKIRQVLSIESDTSMRSSRIVLRFLRAADRALRGGDPAQAERYYRRALLIQDGSARAHAGVARALKAQGQAKGAIAPAARAVELEPEVAGWYVLRGDVQRQLSNLEAARQDWQKALALSPGHRVAMARLESYGK